MSKNKKRILILPGDGIGPEVSVVAKKLLVLLDQKYSLNLEVSEGLLGGTASVSYTHLTLPTIYSV